MTYYEATANPAPPRPQLQGDAQADVCVVGGGFSGLSAALHLAQAGLKTVLLEAATIGFGASGRNGGQLHTGQRVDQDELEKLVGMPHARELWGLAEDAKALVRRLIADYAIDCGLKDALIHAAWKPGAARDLRYYRDHMARHYAYHVDWIEKADVPNWVASERYHGAIFDPGGAQLHPLNYALGIAAAAERAGATLHNDSRATAVERMAQGVRVVTAKGAVTAKHVVLACDTWLGDLARRPGATALAINSFIAVTEPLGEARAKTLIPSGAGVADTKFVVDYYRVTPDHRLLFGGGESYTPKPPADPKPYAVKPMLKVFPQLKDAAIDYGWCGPVGITLNRLPHFGWTDPGTVFAHGFSGQGVAIATLAGKLMAEAVQGIAGGFNVFAKIKHRPIPGGRLFRTPLMALGMAWYALKDRL